MNFLSLYVILLIASIPLLALLHRRRFVTLTALLAATYMAGLLWPRAFTLPNRPDQPSGFDNATWFVLFASGVIAGWVWRDRRIDQLITRPRTMRWITPILLVLAAFVAIDLLPLDEPDALLWLTDKDQLGPGRFIASWVIMITLVFIAARTLNCSTTTPIINAMAILGALALDAVVILTLVTIALQGPLAIESSSRAAQLIALATIAGCWIWAYARQRSATRVTIVD